MGAVAVYMGLVALGNVLDPGSNIAYVQHVLSMDTVFPYSTQKWRAVHHPEVWRLVYVLILVYQSLMATWLGWAAWRLFRASPGQWVAARNFASAALVATLMLWFGAFITVGGEWFQMWQSADWNGIEAASRNFTVHGLILLFLYAPSE